MTTPADSSADPVEIAWFSALCDDDYEFLGVEDAMLKSTYEHCRNIALTADRYGFDNILLPSGYTLGIDSLTFAAAMAPQVEQIKLLLAVRVGEIVVPQMARQLASVDQMLNGRLNINIISSDVPGETMDSNPRYRRTLEVMHVLRELMNGNPVDFHGDHIDLTTDPPRLRTVSGKCPPYYFGGLSPAAKECAAAGADVFLMWPDTVDNVKAVVAEMDERAAKYGRTLKYGWRSHVIVRETEADARAAADRLLSKLDAETGDAIRSRSLDSKSAGVARQAELRESADGEGYAEPYLWTGVGRARSGAGAALVGNPDQIAGRIAELRDAGISAFILSGYPHAAECDLFARHVLSQINHGKLDVVPQPVAI